MPRRPKWEGGKLAGEGYFVNHIPPQAVEQAGGWEPLLKRGREQFNVHCAVCHGTSGRGGGGELHTASSAHTGCQRAARERANAGGSGATGRAVVQHGRERQRRDARLRPSGEGVLDRWAIVAYMRELQFAYGNPLMEKK